MRWSETISSECRWSEIAERIFGESEIIWEDSYADYQGSVKLVALTPDSKIVLFQYDYGSCSCSGCDGWEDMATADVERDFREQCSEVFTDPNEFIRFVNQVTWLSNIRDESMLKFLMALGDMGMTLNEETIKKLKFND